MTYRWPIYTYTLQVALTGGLIATCFGDEGLLDTIPRLAPDLYSIYLHGSSIEVATAAVHESGRWTLNFSDGREFSGRVGEDFPIVV